MSRILPALLLVLTAAALAAACGGGGGTTGEATSTDETGQAAGPPDDYEVLYEEDFEEGPDEFTQEDQLSDSEAATEEELEDYGVSAYDDGVYVTESEKPDATTTRYSPPFIDLELRDGEVRVARDMVVSADVWFNEGEEAAGAVLCRHRSWASDEGVNEDSSYAFAIGSDGTANVYLGEDGEFEKLDGEEVEDFDPAEPVRLTATCIGDELKLYVDDEVVVELEDDQYPVGGAALLYGATGEDVPVEVFFDNFEVAGDLIELEVDEDEEAELTWDDIDELAEEELEGDSTDSTGSTDDTDSTDEG